MLIYNSFSYSLYLFIGVQFLPYAIRLLQHGLQVLYRCLSCVSVHKQRLVHATESVLLLSQFAAQAARHCFVLVFTGAF